jgi:transcription elongation GreA/GreB family factor
MTPIELKEALLLICVEYVKDRKEKILIAISNIEDSLFDEGKSTAGDKHHTGRAMLQIERENIGVQLLEIEKTEAILHKISVYSSTEVIRMGSLVATKNATYFLSISVGLVAVNGGSYICISIGSPIGQLLLGKRKGDTFSFNSNTFQITSVS